MYRLALLVAAAVALSTAPAVAANNFTVKDSAAATITKCSFQQSDGAQADCNVLIDTNGARIDPATRQLQQQMLTALGSPYQAGGPLPLPAGAATAAGQAPIAAPGTVAASGVTVTPVLPQLTLTDIGGVFGASAVQLVAANPNRHLLRIQVQGAADSSGTVGCWINGMTAATADYHSLFIPRGALFESTVEIGTGAVSIICSAAGTPVFARQG